MLVRQPFVVKTITRMRQASTLSHSHTHTHTHLVWTDVSLLVKCTNHMTLCELQRVQMFQIKIYKTKNTEYMH